VLALGVAVTEEEESSEDDESSLDAEEDDVVSSLDVAAAEESSVEEVAADVVAEDVVVVFATLASAGSSPSWTRSASTPKTATKLASAPAAKRRAFGTRRRRGGRWRWGSASGMPSGSTADLNSS
jgi:hypothetical protein